MKNQEDLTRLERLLKNFDIPFYRKVLNKNNLLWLNKNLMKRNKDNPKFEETFNLVKTCIKEKNYYS